MGPGQRLSYQKHFRRSEHWIILEGRARITLDGKEVFLGQGESVDIPHPPKGALTESDREALGEIPLASEEEEARYLHDALDLLRGHGLSGAIARSFSDCDPSLWSKTPFDRRVHERFLGLFRWDGSPKPAADVIQQNRIRRSPKVGKRGNQES